MSDSQVGQKRGRDEGDSRVEWRTILYTLLVLHLLLTSVTYR